MQQHPGARLRALMEDGGVLAPFVWDAGLARFAEAAGHQAVYMTGFGTAFSHGLPDIGLLGLQEMGDNAASIAAAVEVPVIADADTGYGNASSVTHTVERYERAGVGAIHIEDQVAPKRCGFMDGKEVVALDEMLQKVRAAVRARQNDDLVFIARTDALAPLGWEAVVERCSSNSSLGGRTTIGPVSTMPIRQYANTSTTATQNPKRIHLAIDFGGFHHCDEGCPLGADGLFGADELEEPRGIAALCDAAQQHRCGKFLDATHPAVVRPGDLDQVDRHPGRLELDDLHHLRRRAAIGLGKLAGPAVGVGDRVATLPRTEVEHHALAVAGSAGNTVLREAHRVGRLLFDPGCRNRPAQLARLSGAALSRCR